MIKKSMSAAQFFIRKVKFDSIVCGMSICYHRIDEKILQDVDF